MADFISQDLSINSTLTKMTRENYLEVFDNQITTKPSAFMAKIKKQKLKSDSITAGAPIGLNGGFGFGAEGLATPAAAGQLYEKFHVTAKDAYVNLAISVKATKLATKGGALVDALHNEITSAYTAADWNIGRALCGNGTGILTTIEASNGNTIKVADTRCLKEGLVIDIYATGGTTPVAGGKARRIKSLDRAAKTITVDGDSQSFDAGFITVQNSLNKEITGLGAIFDNSVTTLYGVNKEDNPVLYPTAIDAGHDVNDSFITDALMTAEDDKNSQVDLLMCGRDSYNHYVQYLRENNIRVEDRTHVIAGGFKAIKFLVGNREVDVVYEKFVPSGEMWGVESGKFIYAYTPWDFATLDGAGAFNLMENSSVYRALLASYSELICKNPGGCVRIYNCCSGYSDHIKQDS